MQEIEAKDCGKFVQEIIEQEKNLASPKAMKSLKDLRLKIYDLLSGEKNVEIAIFVDSRLYEARIKGKGEQSQLMIDINVDGEMKHRLDKTTSSPSAVWKVMSPIVLVVKYGYYAIASLLGWLAAIATGFIRAISILTDGVEVLLKFGETYVKASDWFEKNRQRLPFFST